MCYNILINNTLIIFSEKNKKKWKKVCKGIKIYTFAVRLKKRKKFIWRVIRVMQSGNESRRKKLFKKSGKKFAKQKKVLLLRSGKSGKSSGRRDAGSCVKKKLQKKAIKSLLKRKKHYFCHPKIRLSILWRE